MSVPRDRKRVSRPGAWVRQKAQKEARVSDEEGSCALCLEEERLSCHRVLALLSDRLLQASGMLYSRPTSASAAFAVSASSQIGWPTGTEAQRTILAPDSGSQSCALALDCPESPSQLMLPVQPFY